ncbi:MAG TPA: aspartate aminotransferase family protein [Candidatus Eremiobacteraceae bacterium]|nr:aspartate aminotransferase family protein [Candidatus Eremiobacteraceae bacterium]
MNGEELGRIVVEPPGPRSLELMGRLREVETPNITFSSERFPVFFERGAGANLIDVDGNTYVDLTAAFGVAATGHSNPQVVEAVADQARLLLHGIGDVHPNEVKVALAEKLCALAPGDGPKRVILSSTGAEAVESALKTATLASGKPGVLCFTGAYHGLTYGALEVTDRDFFRKPFARQLGGFATRVPYAYCYRCPLALTYPSCETACLSFVEEVMDSQAGETIGAVIVEAIQGRGGDVNAPFDWLLDLRELCDRRKLLLIVDEVYTGFGRTGRWFACEHAGVVPDLLCVGKGMASGFPISACIGSERVMDAWPPSHGEAIHTSTFLGHPTGCAAALASIAEIERLGLVARAASNGEYLGGLLKAAAQKVGPGIGDVRGCGLMWGIELVKDQREPDASRASSAVTQALRRGVVVLAGGPENNVLSLSPPLVITREQLAFGVETIGEALA